jgi:hypothetical protein
MLALILIASFAIDRIVTALLFLLSFIHKFPAAGATTGGRQSTDTKLYNLLYFGLAALLSALVIAFWGPLTVLPSLRMHDPIFDQTGNRIFSLDSILTLIILVGGADRIAALLDSKLGVGAPKASTTPLVVEGRITLEDKEPTKN